MDIENCQRKRTDDKAWVSDELENFDIEIANLNKTVHATKELNEAVMDHHLKGFLEETYQYADSKKFMSWEEFYTWYLADITRNTIYQYGKTRLAEAIQNGGNSVKNSCSNAGKCCSVNCLMERLCLR